MLKGGFLNSVKFIYSAITLAKVQIKYNYHHLSDFNSVHFWSKHLNYLAHRNFICVLLLENDSTALHYVTEYHKHSEYFKCIPTTKTSSQCASILYLTPLCFPTNLPPPSNFGLSTIQSTNSTLLHI